ncbi:MULTISPECIES: hypothetical protein [unclassified Streptomyces]|uniref:hypothetical protein n=1 Tax=unclassified Streptomyces TaxID=2593676 RepID=UPI003811AFEA
MHLVEPAELGHGRALHVPGDDLFLRQELALLVDGEPGRFLPRTPPGRFEAGHHRLDRDPQRGRHPLLRRP